MEGKLAEYVVTSGEEFYGDKNIVPTNQSYFDFSVDTKTGTATITGVKDEYAVKAYQNGEATTYTVVIKDGDTYIKDVVIPYEYVDESGNKYLVTAIGESAFLGVVGSGYTNVDERFTSFVLPNTITNVMKKAFSGCENLVTIHLSKSLVSIGQSVFFGCANLTTIALPEGISNIESSVFQNCTKLSRINIPNSVINIPNNLFMNCTNLENIKIPDTVKTMGSSVFLGCENLRDIEIPSRCYNHKIWYISEVYKLE